MDKYDGMNKPEISLSENVPKFGEMRSKGAAPCSDKSDVEPDKPARKGVGVLRFLLRAAASAAVLAFVFLPRFFPYRGSEKVTDTVKTIIMTDITYSENVGSGALVDLIRKLFASDDEK